MDKKNLKKSASKSLPFFLALVKKEKTLIIVPLVFALLSFSL